MATLKTVGFSVRHLRQTVHARYGTGMRAYASFFYMSLLRTNTFIVFVYDTDDPPVSMPHCDPLAFSPADHDTLDELRRNHALPSEFYCDRAHGARDFVLGWWQGEAAYIHWIFRENERSRFLSLGKGCANIEYMVTLPDFRGRRICSYALVHSIKSLRAEGVKYIYSVIHADNIASIKAVERVGFRRFSKAKTIGPFNTRRNVVA